MATSIDGATRLAAAHTRGCAVEIKNVAVLAGDGIRNPTCVGHSADRAGIGRAPMATGITGARPRCRDLARDRLWPAGSIAAVASHQIDVDVIVMRGVIARRQDGCEIVARSELHVVQKSLLLGSAVPTLLHGYAPSVGKRECRDIDRVPKGMLGYMRCARANHAAARIG